MFKDEVKSDFDEEEGVTSKHEEVKKEETEVSQLDDEDKSHGLEFKCNNTVKKLKLEPK